MLLLTENVIKTLKRSVCSNRFFGGFQNKKFSLSFSLFLSLGEHSLALCSRVICFALLSLFLYFFFPSLSFKEQREELSPGTLWLFDEFFSAP